MAVDSILRAAELGDLCALEIVDDRERERGCHASELLSSDAEAFELYGSGYGDGYGDGSGYGYGLQISISQADENGLVSPQVSDATKAEGPER